MLILLLIFFSNKYITLLFMLNLHLITVVLFDQHLYLLRWLF